jgi:hypothetical protein
MIALDGATKTITLSSATSYIDKDIYDAAIVWSVLSGSMQYLLPMDFVAPNFRLLNGWKLNASGFASGTLITVTGSIIATTGDRVVGGTNVEWDIGTANNTIIVSVGSGLSLAEHNQLFGIPDLVVTDMDANSKKLNLIPTMQTTSDSI